ncbi:PorP/SprF family type IX secretion system membrane protein [Hymenobacter qilianensis]|nr:PorP/SprF family type IX secretion system membrane protein [Hymenobacter qilianensis]
MRLPLLSFFAPQRLRCTWSRFVAPVVLAVGCSMGLHSKVQAQDLYFSQPYATRLHTNPAFTGLLDDYSVSLNYRNQFPTLSGTFQTSQLAADYRMRNQRSAVGLLLNYDRTGSVGYTRFEVGGLYAYHTRLTEYISLSAGLQASYGNQRVSYGNLVFGDQLSDEGLTGNLTAETLDVVPVNYLTIGVGGLLYTERFWIGAAAHHLNQPDLGFATQTKLPMRLNFNTGYKHYFVRTSTPIKTREISLTGTASYTRQGGSQRAEVGLYGTVSPITLGAVYRGMPLPGAPQPQQIIAAIAGISTGVFRFGYSYDVSLSDFSADLGGAHELSVSVRNFDRIEDAWRRLRHRNFKAIPTPAF